MPALVWLSGHQGATLKQSKSQERSPRCEARTKQKCPLFTGSTAGTWTLSTSVKLIFRPWSLYCHRGFSLLGTALKTQRKNGWHLQNSSLTIKRSAMVWTCDAILPRTDSNHWFNNQYLVSQRIMWSIQLCFENNDLYYIFPLCSIQVFTCASLQNPARASCEGHMGHGSQWLQHSKERIQDTLYRNLVD